MKTFKARSMTAAVKAIKEELGADAVILATRHLHDGTVEVMADRDEEGARQPLGEIRGVFTSRDGGEARRPTGVLPRGSSGSAGAGRARSGGSLGGAAAGGGGAPAGPGAASGLEPGAAWANAGLGGAGGTRVEDSPVRPSGARDVRNWMPGPLVESASTPIIRPLGGAAAGTPGGGRLEPASSSAGRESSVSVVEPYTGTGSVLLESLNRDVRRLQDELTAMRDSLQRQEGLSDAVEEIRSLLRGLGGERSRPRLAAPLEALRPLLLGSGMGEPTVAELLRLTAEGFPERGNSAEALQRLGKVLLERVRIAPAREAGDADGRARVVALVGPTGVGKTTTVAKLAAQAALRDGKRVALISVDTFRMAGIEHLGRYAEIIGVPFDVAVTPAAFQAALEEHEDKDLVLVDTTGRSPEDERGIAALVPFLVGGEQVPEVHLAVTPTTSPLDLVRMGEAYAPCGYAHLVLCKLDEGGRIGGCVELQRRLGASFSYLTTGQRVPEDLEPASAERVVQLLLDPEEFRRLSATGGPDE